MALAYDFLCRHHSCVEFDCGEPTLNREIQVAVSDPPDPARLLFIVGHDQNVIRAFVSLADVTVDCEVIGQPRFCLMLPSWGRDAGRTRAGVARALIREATRIYVSREERDPRYYAIVATSMYTERIEPRLSEIGFKRCAGIPHLWYLRPDFGGSIMKDQFAGARVDRFVPTSR